MTLTAPSGSNANSMPFGRPSLGQMLGAIDFIQANDYPARGSVNCFQDINPATPVLRLPLAASGRSWVGTHDERRMGLMTFVSARHLLTAHNRGAIFTEAAGSATDTRLPYWMVLLLAAGIASLGLSLDSAAVVIGAMLVAPILAPVIGLALALAVGDSRLAVRIVIVLVASTIGVIAVAALLTVALPFHTLTAQISARTRPTMLDLIIAIFSGLAGAVVTVARGSRLSGTVPGVAVSVALVPPLAAAGYGIGTGWNWAIVSGSLLLYGANLAGIVISAMAMFLMVGMHHRDVLVIASAWHREDEAVGLWKWLKRVPGLRSLGILASPWARVALVLSFVALVAVPLSASLRQIAREARVQHAVEIAAKRFSRPGRSFVVSRDVAIGSDVATVTLNVATTSWFADSARTSFEREASRLSGEPVTLLLEQLPASTGDIRNFATLFATNSATHAAAPARKPNALASIAAARSDVDLAMKSVVLPDSVALLGYDFEVTDATATSGMQLHVVYLAPDTLATQASQLIARQIQGTLSMPDLAISETTLPSGQRSIDRASPLRADSVASLLSRYRALGASVSAGPEVTAQEMDSIVATLRGPAMDSSRVTVTRFGRHGTFVQLRVQPARR